MITTYAGFLDHLGRMVTFEGDNPGDASIGTLQKVIAMAEARIYREVRSMLNTKAFSGTVTSNAFALPSDFRSASTVSVGGVPLQPVAYEQLLDELQYGSTFQAKHFAHAGGSLYFAPSLTDGTAVGGTYFFAYPELDESNIASNALFLANLDLFTFACMVEAAPLYGFMDQLQLWESKYALVRDSINGLTARAAYSAGRMQRSSSTKLMG